MMPLVDVVELERAAQMVLSASLVVMDDSAACPVVPNLLLYTATVNEVAVIYRREFYQVGGGPCAGRHGRLRRSRQPATP